MKRVLCILFAVLMLGSTLMMSACENNNATPQQSNSAITMQYVTKEDLKTDIDAGGNAYIIIDVRKVADYAEQHITGAYSGDVDPSISGADNATSTANLKVAIKEATGSETGNTDSKFVLVCYSGKKYAETATSLLVEMGISAASIYTLEGGHNGFKDAGADYAALLQSAALQSDALQSVAADAKSEKLLTADDLETLMDNSNVKVFDLRSAEDFEAGHIPGAINIGNKEFEDPDNPVDGEIATVEQFEKLMSSYGITADDIIVVYSNAENPQMAPRLIWTLAVYAHTNTYILDGHYQHWVSAGKPIETGVNKDFTASEYKVKGINSSINVNKDAVINKSAATIVLDCRPAEEYIGDKVATGNARGGHIPDAVNMFYMSVVNEEGFFKDAAELAALYNDIGVTGDKEIIVYCQRGHRASHTWFTLTYLLGFDNVKVYDGSMMEWSNLPELPIATGEDVATAAGGSDAECE